MSPTEAKQQLTKEGFEHIYEWRDAPGTSYPPHRHKDKVTLFILSGSLEFHINEQTFGVKEGARFDVPPETTHTAEVGPEGCAFMVGEMIHGDS